jgi:hypothetical protein
LTTPNVDLSSAGVDGLRAYLRETLRAPIDFTHMPHLDREIKMILRERWYHALAAELPHDEGLDELLTGAWGRYYAEPDLDELDEALTDDIEIMRALAYNVRSILARVRGRYIEDCERVLRLRALTREEYPKHYVAQTESSAATQKRSLATP